MGGTGEMRYENKRVGRVDHRRFGRAHNQLTGVIGVPLVEGVVAHNQHGEALVGSPSGPPDLLTK